MAGYGNTDTGMGTNTGTGLGTNTGYDNTTGTGTGLGNTSGTGLGNTTGTGYGAGTGGGMMGETHYYIYDIFAELDDSVKDSTDAYAQFEIGAHSVKTAVNKNAGAQDRVVWSGDQYRLRKHASNLNKELVVSVYAKKTLLPDGLIGRGEVNMHDITDQSTVMRVPLVNKKGTNQGYLSFNISEQSGAGNDYAKDSGMGTGMATGMDTGVGTGTTTDTGYGTGAGMAAVEENTRTTTTTTTERLAQDVCDRQTFTTIEDRPIIKEQKIYTKEHHPYEKEYAVETKYVGEQYLGAANTEALGIEERVVEEATPAAPCADAPAIGQQALAGARDNQTGMGGNQTGMGGNQTGMGGNQTGMGAGQTTDTYGQNTSTY